MRNGLWWGATGAGGTAVTTASHSAIALAGGIGLVGGAFAYFDAAWVAYRNDEPRFDSQTTFLFDTAATIVCILLFVVPAMRLDFEIKPNAPLPGLFGYAAMFLSAFLIPVTRGLLCNLGLVREADHELELGLRTSDDEASR
jgi:hypothetical protein